jgi:hypothetical protein
MKRSEGENMQKKSADIIDQMQEGTHLRTIRNALKEGRAAVMIGSGFSRNADGGKRLPLWGPLMDGLLADIYPEGKAREQAKSRFNGTSGMLRLAEEYQALHKRAQLDARLHELLPDAGVVNPGELHTRLLSLNWTDVFTTNYDTLLERTLDADRRRFPFPRIKSRYQVVTAASDVAYSRRNGRPRIVKLHGTLRSGTRLIVTEEDYRNYPRQFAPFVNTVQQSMLENVFVLIGFSGDDSNFLAWTGWVRDHLGEKSPSLYYVTRGPVPEGQRLILEQRHIHSINIEPLGQQGNGTSDYGKALLELVTYWQDDPPVRRAKWPLHPPAREFNHQSANVEELVGWLLIVQKNRAEYPGWLVAPAGNRDRLFEQASLGQAMKKFDDLKEKLPQWLRVVFLNEIVWIMDVVMKPLLPFYWSLMAEELDTDRSAENVNFVLPDSVDRLRVSDSEIVRMRATLALAMLRDAREDDNGSSFEKWLRWFNALGHEQLSAEQHCNLLHEQLLYHLEHRHIVDALDLLEKLVPVTRGDVDPYWRIRLGALFGELNIVARGFEIAKSGLHDIRDAIQFDGESAYLLSREQWGEWLVEALMSSNRRDPKNLSGINSQSAQSTSDLWSPESGLQLRIAEAQANTEVEEVQELKVERNENARDNMEHPYAIMDDARYELNLAESMLESSVINFDVRRVPPEKRPPYLRNEAAVAANTYVRLIERVSLPPAIGNMGYGARTLENCFRILSLKGAANASLRLLMRASAGAGMGSSADTLDLAIVSMLGPERASIIFDRCLNGIQSITEDTKLDRSTRFSLSAMLDIASRLAFRLEVESAISLCDLAIHLYRLKLFQSDYQMHRSLRTLFERTLSLLPANEIAEFYEQLLVLSTSKTSSPGNRYSWPDIARMLPRPDVAFPKYALSTVSGQLLDELEQLPSLHQSSEATQHLKALHWIFAAKQMTERQEERFGKLVWRDVPEGSLPRAEGFVSSIALMWPVAPNKRAKVTSTFKHWIAETDVPDMERDEDIGGERKRMIGMPDNTLFIELANSTIFSRDVKWSESELLHLLEKMRNWWHREGERLSIAAESKTTDDMLRTGVAGRLLAVAAVTHYVVSDVVTREALESHGYHDWFKSIWDAGMRIDSALCPLLFAGTRWWPELEDAALDCFIANLDSSQDEAVTGYALDSASVWLARHEKPTASTRRYISYLISNLRGGAEFQVERKLNALTKLLESEQRIHIEEELDVLISKLCGLMSDLQTGRLSYSGKINLYASPLLRVAAAKTIVALGNAFASCKSAPTWNAAWDLVRTDTLLLVRKQTL